MGLTLYHTTCLLFVRKQRCFVSTCQKDEGSLSNSKLPLSQGTAQRRHKSSSQYRYESKQQQQRRRRQQQQQLFATARAIAKRAKRQVALSKKVNQVWSARADEWMHCLWCSWNSYEWVWLLGSHFPSRHPPPNPFHFLFPEFSSTPISRAKGSVFVPRFRTNFIFRRYIYVCVRMHVFM